MFDKLTLVLSCLLFVVVPAQCGNFIFVAGASSFVTGLVGHGVCCGFWSHCGGVKSTPDYIKNMLMVAHTASAGLNVLGIVLINKSEKKTNEKMLKQEEQKQRKFEMPTKTRRKKWWRRKG